MVNDTIKSSSGIPHWKRRLYLPTYSVKESARYAKTTPQTIGHWHYYEGKVGPAISGKTKGKSISYLQLIEIAFVATMRKQGMSLQKIRKTREYARQNLEVEYPFAQLEWKTEGVHLLLELRDIEGETEANKLLVENELIAGDLGGQIGWKPAMAERFREFHYEDGLALIWYLRGLDCPVRIDPRISFGAPTIDGLPTWVIKGRWNVGETIQEIKEDFNLVEKNIIYALNFEGIELQSQYAS